MKHRCDNHQTEARLLESRDKEFPRSALPVTGWRQADRDVNSCMNVRIACSSSHIAYTVLSALVLVPFQMTAYVPHLIMSDPNYI